MSNDDFGHWNGCPIPSNHFVENRLYTHAQESWISFAIYVWTKITTTPPGHRLKEGVYDRFSNVTGDDLQFKSPCSLYSIYLYTTTWLIWPCLSPHLSIYPYLQLTSPCLAPHLSIYHYLQLTSPCLSPHLSIYPYLQLTSPCLSPHLSIYHYLQLTSPCLAPHLSIYHCLQLTSPCLAPHLSIYPYLANITMPLSPSIYIPLPGLHDHAASLPIYLYTPTWLTWQCSLSPHLSIYHYLAYMTMQPLPPSIYIPLLGLHHHTASLPIYLYTTTWLTWPCSLSPMYLSTYHYLQLTSSYSLSPHLSTYHYLAYMTMQPLFHLPIYYYLANMTMPRSPSIYIPLLG